MEIKISSKEFIELITWFQDLVSGTVQSKTHENVLDAIKLLIEDTKQSMRMKAIVEKAKAKKSPGRPKGSNTKAKAKKSTVAPLVPIEEKKEESRIEDLPNVKEETHGSLVEDAWKGIPTGLNDNPLQGELFDFTKEEKA